MTGGESGQNDTRQDQRRQEYRRQDISKPLDTYPLAKPEDMPTPPPPGAPGEPVVAAAKVPANAPANAPVRTAEVAVLEFLDPDKLRDERKLEHPFRLGGTDIMAITARALSVIEVGEIATSNGVTDYYPYFAAMTGLPAAVLRAMPASDGGMVLEMCSRFLPRWLTADA